MSAAGTASRTNQVRSCMSNLLERVGDVAGGRLLIGIRPRTTLPSQGDHSYVATGSSNWNVDPRPGSESTQISPPIDWISSRQM